MIASFRRRLIEHAKLRALTSPVWKRRLYALQYGAGLRVVARLGRESVGGGVGKAR